MDTRGTSLKKKIIMSYLILLAIFCMIVGITIVAFGQYVVKEEIGKSQISLLNTVVSDIDSEKLSGIINKQDSSLPYYKELKAYLTKVIAVSGMKYLYIESYLPGTEDTIYVVEGDSLNDNEAAKFGELVNMPKEKIDTNESRNALNGIPSHSTVSDSKKWGELISTYVPIKDLKGNVVAMISSDYDVTAIKHTTEKIFIAVFGCLIILFTFLAFFIYRMISKFLNPLSEFTKGMQEVAEGRFNQEIKIRSGDEIELLSNDFNIMVQKINKLLEERDENVRQVEQNNKEMSAQRDEISVLYQHTAAMNMELNGYLDEIKENYLSTVRALANAIDAKDKYTKGHCERVTEYSMKIGKQMGLRDVELSNLEFASLLHDIGKIGIPASIINKSTSLTDAEFEKIKQHPIIGYEILKEVRFLESSVEILLQHHERMDGKGYPYQLKGEQISKYAQILAVADSYDAMISSRPYRKLNTVDAVMELERNKGTQFSEEVVQVFIGLLKDEMQ